VNWIVFDYGEVISKRTEAIPDLAAVLGVGEAAFLEQYWALREPYDRGSSDLEYWGSVGKALGVEIDESTSDTLTAIDIAGWLHTEPATLELLGALDEAGAALALLSNAPSSFGRVAEKQDWARYFRTLVFSGDLGCAKPDPQIFKTLVTRLGAEPGDCLFFDDRQVNIDGAIAAGLRANLWLGAETARGHLD
jgi:putative hydrolase of the HAD superfamily